MFMAIFDGTSAYVIDSKDFDCIEMENLGESENEDTANDYADDCNDEV